MRAEPERPVQRLFPFLPKPLLEPRNPGSAILVAWLLAFVPSIALAGIIELIAPQAETPEFGITGPMAIVLLVLFSPIVESLIMGGLLLILLRFLPPAWAVIASAVGWGIAHSLAIPIWGLIIWWPFLIFSTLFVVWRERSIWLAFGLPMVVHGLQNLPPALLVAFGIA